MATVRNRRALVTRVKPFPTQHEQMFRLDGLGLPDLRTGRRADLVVVAKLEVPTKLTSRQEELLREFAGIEDQSGGVSPHGDGFWKKIKDAFGA